MFLLKNGYMSIVNIYFREIEAILSCNYDEDETLRLKIFNAISVEDEFY